MDAGGNHDKSNVKDQQLDNEVTQRSSDEGTTVQSVLKNIALSPFIAVYGTYQLGKYIVVRIPDALSYTAVAAYENILVPVAQVVKAGAEFVGTALYNTAVAAYENILVPVAQVVKAGAEYVGTALYNTAVAAYENILVPVAQVVKAGAEYVGTALYNTAAFAYENVLTPATNTYHYVINEAYDLGHQVQEGIYNTYNDIYNAYNNMINYLYE